MKVPLPDQGVDEMYVSIYGAAVGSNKTLMIKASSDKPQVKPGDGKDTDLFDI